MFKTIDLKKLKRFSMNDLFHKDFVHVGKNSSLNSTFIWAKFSYIVLKD